MFKRLGNIATGASARPAFIAAYDVKKEVTEDTEKVNDGVEDAKDKVDEKVATT